MPEFPLIIIGAGPAGMSTALHLLALDPEWAGRMVVLDRCAHPRHKLCGGGVTRLGLGYLRGLGLPDPLPIPHAPVRDARFIYRDRTVHVYGRPEIVVFHRREFDNYLARTARERGARIHENVRVREIRVDPDGVTVATDAGDYRGLAAVGADGSRGISRRYVGTGGVREPEVRRRPFTRRFRLPAGSTSIARIARLLEVVQPAAEEAPQFRREFASFDFTPAAGELQGYAWDFPARIEGAPHHNRGVYDARIATERPKAALPDLLRRSLTGADPGKDEAGVEGHPIHWFSPRNRVSGERLILVGDAAGAEPLFGEGIAPALGYGEIAAKAVAAAFRERDFSFSDYKRRLLLSRLGRYLLLRWWIAWWSYRLSGRRWFMEIVWTVGEALAALTNRFNDSASQRFSESSRRR